MNRCLVIEPEPRREHFVLTAVLGGIVGLCVLGIALLISGCGGRIEQDGCPGVVGSSEIDTTTLTVSCHPGETADVPPDSQLSPVDWATCSQVGCSLTCTGSTGPITAVYADAQWVSTWQTETGCTVKTALAFR